MTGPGGGYQISRRAVMTDTTAVGVLNVTGSDGMSQGQHRLSMLLGQVDEAIFTNVFAIGLRELQELNTLDDTAAADELYKLSSGLDRVSLVEVMRRLRKARENLVGTDPNDPADGRVAELLLRRDKLRTEIEDLSRKGRRWAELAGQRRAQLGEIDTLRQRLGEWQAEAKSTELALNIRDIWRRRARLQVEIDATGRGLELPDTAPAKLKEFDQKIAERNSQLDEIKNRRRQLRQEAEAVPVSRRLLDLQPKIDAANQQSPWIEEAQNQLQRVEAQLEQARKALADEAERVGISEEDRQALLEGKESVQLPELTKQGMSALMGPARAVRDHGSRIKQFRDEAAEGKRESDRLNERILVALKGLPHGSLTDAVRAQGEAITVFRRRIQLEEHLEKLRRHVRDLEREAVDLTTARALPIDRTILLAAPFLAGGVTLLYGVLHILDVFVVEADSAWGALIGFFGLLMLSLYFMGRKLTDRNTDTDIEACDRQLDVARKQLKELERDRMELEAQLPPGSGSIEQRLRESEEKLVELEGLLPAYHSQQAALLRYRNARQKGNDAIASLKNAKQQWRRTLTSMGLDESLTPKSIQQISRGFDSLQAARRRLAALQSERDQRKRELAGLAQRVEGLYRQAFAETPTTRRDSNVSSETTNRERPTDRGEKSTRPDRTDRANTKSASVKGDNNKSSAIPQPVAQVRPQSLRADRDQPLAQLQHLNEEIARQQHWIDRRKELREHDSQLKKQQLTVQRHLDRYHQMRRSLLARCGVEDDQGFQELVDRKARLARLTHEHQEVDQQIRAAIGQQVPYDEIARQLDSVKADELERRWDALLEKMNQTEQRIAQLLSRQGELAQEMRQQAGDSRLSFAQLDLGAVESQLNACVRHWQTLGTTSQLLDEVCRTFEKERQPETLREASSFLAQLTDGKYGRIWTPLGTNALKVDNHKGESLPLEVLSRGTREAVFIALRLALASAYARRGVMLPLVLDDVLVNFDRSRALHAAKTLKLFAQMGHQVMMFTCHQHIVDIFHEIEVEVRRLPEQGHPGIAEVLHAPALTVAVPMIEDYEEEEEEEIAEPVEAYEEEVAEDEFEEEEEEVVETPVAEAPVVVLDEPEYEPEPIAEAPPPPPLISPAPLPIVEMPPAPPPEPEPELVRIERTPKLKRPRPVVEAPVSEKSGIDWLWYELGPTIEEAVHDGGTEEPPAEVFDAWWDRPASAK